VGVAIVESLESLAVAGEIAGVDGIDVVYFGAYDLSQELGYPGEPLHPEVVDAISEGVARVDRANCCAGGFVPRDRAGVQWLLELGMGFITFDVDSSILGTAVADVVEWFRLDAD
jgi:4-hydroxy-2-oxoheptanedioate aldolase